VAYKIGSGECNNYPLIEHVASFGKPVILSTGMNTIESIKGAVEILRGYGVPFALLHCTNLYPTPDHLIRLGGMVELQSAFPDAVIGLSDHSIDNLACIAATALGASVLERHFTDHKQRPGPDIVCSMDEQECRELIENVARVALMRGGSKTPAKEEQVTANFAFACVVSLRDIKEGETFSMENIWVKRPGTGDIPARDFKKILGARATRDIKANTFLKNDDVEGWRV
jgi:N-acetylneuraminate synthase